MPTCSVNKKLAMVADQSMARKLSELRSKMSPESQAGAAARAEAVLV